MFGFFQSFFPVFFFFHGERNSTGKVFLFATTVEFNSQNNCIKSFSFRRYKEKRLSLLAASWKIPFMVLRKILLNVKHFFPSVI